MKARARWLVWTALAIVGMGALWCCRREVSGGVEEELVSGGESDAQRGPLGTNVAAIGYAYRNFPFVDLMRSSDPFHSGTVDEWNDGRALALRDDGYPARLEPGQIARTFLVGGEDPHFGGELVVRYEGQGEIAYLGGVENVERSPGRDVVTLRERDGLWVEISATDPADPLHAVRIFAPGGRCDDAPMDACRADADCDGRCVPFEETYESEPFHPTFLAEHAPFDVIRFMNWMRSNRVRGDEEPRPEWPIREWAGYPAVGHQNWRTVPVDVMVDLANATDAAPWFNMPHRASDAFVRRFAERVRERLDPEADVYLELGNEVWNDLFAQAQEVAADGCRALADDPTAECDDDADGTLCEYGEWNETQERCAEYGRRWFARRTAEVGAIWDEVFDGDARVITVLGMQVGTVADRAAAMLDAEHGGAPLREQFDAVAIAPYFGGGEPPASLEAIFERAELPNGESTYAVLLGAPPDGGPLQWILRDLRALRGSDVALIAYEGGQHFLALGDADASAMLTEANRDPRMGELYDEYLRRWAALTGGALFVHYRSPSGWSEWGTWGSKEYQGQPLDAAPKHQALLRYLDR